jgi:hypothetical protein
MRFGTKLLCSLMVSHATVASAGALVEIRPQASSAKPVVRRPAAGGDGARRVFAAQVQSWFFWVRAMSKPTIPACDLRAGTGLGGHRHDSGQAIAERFDIPFWVLERLNPGRDLSFVSCCSSLRVPAVTAAVARRCFTPDRDVPTGTHGAPRRLPKRSPRSTV